MEHFTATIRDGTLVLPARAATALGIVPGQKATLSAEIAGDEIEVRNEHWVVRARALLRPFLPADGRSLVDELIAERRAEAAREDVEFRRHLAEFAPARAVDDGPQPPSIAETP